MYSTSADGGATWQPIQTLDGTRIQDRHSYGISRIDAPETWKPLELERAYQRSFYLELSRMMLALHPERAGQPLSLRVERYGEAENENQNIVPGQLIDTTTVPGTFTMQLTDDAPAVTDIERVNWEDVPDLVAEGRMEEYMLSRYESYKAGEYSQSLTDYTLYRLTGDFVKGNRYHLYTYRNNHGYFSDTWDDVRCVGDGEIYFSYHTGDLSEEYNRNGDFYFNLLWPSECSVGADGSVVLTAPRPFRTVAQHGDLRLNWDGTPLLEDEY